MASTRVVFAFLVGLSTLATHAAADDAVDAACVADHGRALDLRKAGKLGEARDKLRECAADRCPDVLRAECTTLFEDVERDMPSVVVSVEDESGSVQHPARLFVDGALRPLSASAIPLDPGDHSVRVERNGRSVERKVRLLQGEKNVRVALRFETPKPTTPKPEKRRPGKSSTSSGNGALVIGLGAVSVIALGGFSYFAVKGYGQEKDLDDCSPNCTNSAYDDMYRNYRYADIALAVSAVTAGAAIYLALSSGSSKTGVAVEARRVSLRSSF